LLQPPNEYPDLVAEVDWTVKVSVEESEICVGADAPEPPLSA
jgi:hypothetical protein